MNRIHEIRNLDDLIFEEFQKYFPKTMDSNFSKSYPKTLHVSNLFNVSTNFIKNSIFDCSENGDLFGVNILLRCQIEHFLRFKYIFFNWMKFKNDDVAERYLEFTEAGERLDQLKSEIAKHKLSNPEFEVSSWEEILEDIPSLRKYSKQEIEVETKNYTYKNIIKTLKEIDEDTETETETSFLGSLITEYSRLSSFVHGGAGAHNQMQMFVLSDESKRSEEFVRITILAYQMVATVKLFSLLMMLQTDKIAFENHYIEIYALLKKANEI